MTNQVGQQRAVQQERVDTPLSLTGLSPTEDLENFVEELKKVFEVMHVVDVERVELVVYQLKGVART